jgi:hypothetical protein
MRAFVAWVLGPEVKALSEKMAGSSDPAFLLQKRIAPLFVAHRRAGPWRVNRRVIRQREQLVPDAVHQLLVTGTGKIRSPNPLHEKHIAIEQPLPLARRGDVAGRVAGVSDVEPERSDRYHLAVGGPVGSGLGGKKMPNMAAPPWHEKRQSPV